MFDEDQVGYAAQSGLGIETSAEARLGSAFSSSATDKMEKVAAPQPFAETIDRARQLISELVINATSARRLYAALLVEGVRLVHESQVHSDKFGLLLEKMQIKVNAGNDVVCRQVVAVLFASLTKGDGSLADKCISKYRRSRFTKALARAIALAKDCSGGELEAKIVASGGYSTLAKYEVEARRHAARTAKAVDPETHDSSGMVGSKKHERPQALGRMRLRAPIAQPTLALIYPGGSVYPVLTSAEDLDRYIREVGRGA
jgi:hypothetical protein